MKLSNLRIENGGGHSYLICSMEAKFTKVNSIWFSMPEAYEEWLTDDVYDAFLVASLYPAMYYNEGIEIDGNVSEKLYFNTAKYVQSVIKSYRPNMNYVNISVKGFAKCKKIRQDGVGTGFSAGIDSFVTLYDHYVKESNPDFKITSFFFFNVGSHGGGGTIARERFHKRFEYLKSFPQKLGLPYVPVDSNLFDFYIKEWEYDAGVFCRACAILVLEKAFSLYYLSSTHAYSEIMRNLFDLEHSDLAALGDYYINPMLSTESIDIVTDGAQYTRTEKTARIIDYPPVKEYLNVCVNSLDDYVTAKNCSECPKCMRTLIAIESLGKLDDFRSVFDINLYKKHSFRYKCELRLGYNKDIFYKDNVDFAVAHGNHIPSYAIAWLRLFPSRAKGKLKRIIKRIIGRK